MVSGERKALPATCAKELQLYLSCLLLFKHFHLNTGLFLFFLKPNLS